jgi:DNA-binding NarL/FixJ family response regulator
MTENPIRIVILEHQELVRAGLRTLLEKRQGMEVVGEAGTLIRGMELVSTLKPDIILVDLNFDIQTTVDVITGILKASNLSRIILLPGTPNQVIIQRAVESGVVGVVLKSQSPEMLYKAIEKVNNVEVWLERSMIANVLSRLSRKDQDEKSGFENGNINCLSQREKEIIALIGQGYKNKRIAEKLVINETTVRHHLTSIYNKLGVTDRLELLVFAHRYGLIKSFSQ